MMVVVGWAGLGVCVLINETAGPRGEGRAAMSVAGARAGEGREARVRPPVVRVARDTGTT